MYASLSKSSMSFSVQSRVGNACRNIMISLNIVSVISLQEIVRTYLKIHLYKLLRPFDQESRAHI